MPGRRIFDLIEITDQLWLQADVLDALHRRDIGRLFILLNEYAGVSQTRLAIACDTTQPKVSAYMRGIVKVEALEGFRADRGRAGHARPRARRPRPGPEGGQRYGRLRWAG